LAVTEFAEDQLVLNGFLGGRLGLWQPRKGYRAGVDPVLLAASVPARAGQTVLDLGCGAGAAALCLATRVPGLDCVGIERQPEFAALARRNSAHNALPFQVLCADLANPPPEVTARQFDHVLANPPYFRAGAHSPSPDAAKGAARGEETPLETWLDLAARRLRPGGYLHMIQRIDRLPEALAACRLGSVEVLPLAPREGRDPGLFILRARKGGRAAFRLRAPLILHRAATHEQDGEDYSDEILSALRNGAPLTWADCRGA
jgi:tRNA1(Val) A37 N6-methylase TrmN6